MYTINIYHIFDKLSDGVKNNYICENDKELARSLKIQLSNANTIENDDVTINLFTFIEGEYSYGNLIARTNALKEVIDENDSYKIDDVENNYSITNYLIGMDGVIYNMRDYKSVMDNKDTIRSLGIQKVSQDPTKYRKDAEAELNKKSTKLNLLKEIQNLVILTTVYEILEDDAEKKKNEIDEYAEENIKENYISEFDMILDKMDRLFPDSDDIEITGVEYNGKKITTDEFTQELSTHRYPGYYEKQVPIEDTLKDSYTIYTTRGIVKKSPSTDIYDMNIEIEETEK